MWLGVLTIAAGIVLLINEKNDFIKIQKMDKLKIGYLFLGFVIFLSCQGRTAQKIKKKDLIVSLDSKKMSSDMIVGKWIIDSIAEDGVIAKILENSDTSYEGLYFDHKNRVQTVRRTARFEEGKPLCDFELKGDSLFFITSGRVFQKYRVVKLRKNVIVLHGNFFIADEIRKKPSFYLSKVKEVKNKRVFGP